MGLIQLNGYVYFVIRSCINLYCEDIKNYNDISEYIELIVVISRESEVTYDTAADERR